MTDLFADTANTPGQLHWFAPDGEWRAALLPRGVHMWGVWRFTGPTWRFVTTVQIPSGDATPHAIWGAVQATPR